MKTNVFFKCKQLLFISRTEIETYTHTDELFRDGFGGPFGPYKDILKILIGGRSKKEMPYLKK